MLCNPYGLKAELYEFRIVCWIKINKSEKLQPILKKAIDWPVQETWMSVVLSLVKSHGVLNYPSVIK